jgi:hypothetical protein
MRQQAHIKGVGEIDYLVQQKPPTSTFQLLPWCFKGAETAGGLAPGEPVKAIAARIGKSYPVTDKPADHEVLFTYGVPSSGNTWNL